MTPPASGLRRLLFLAVVLVFAAAPAAAVRPSAGPRNGVALAEIHPGHGIEAFETSLDAIRDLGASWTMIPVFGWTDSAAAPGLDPGWAPDTTPAEYRAFAARVVRAAHRRGLAVLLIPYVNLKVDDGVDWRGNLRPPDWDAWFRSYTDFITGWAAFSREQQVDLLAVGAELVSSEDRTESWLGVVRAVRAVYDGPLTYSCNWDHYRAVRYTDALDVVGISGYYSLPQDAPLTAESVESNWREVKAELVGYSHAVNRRILFTEIGYPSVTGGSRDPWNYLMTGEPDPAEQARSLAAFFRVWTDTPELDGAFVWNWSPVRGGPLDTSYSIHGKPAASVVRRWLHHGFARDAR